MKKKGDPTGALLNTFFHLTPSEDRMENFSSIEKIRKATHNDLLNDSLLSSVLPFNTITETGLISYLADQIRGKVSKKNYSKDLNDALESIHYYYDIDDKEEAIKSILHTLKTYKKQLSHEDIIDIEFINIEYLIFDKKYSEANSLLNAIASYKSYLSHQQIFLFHLLSGKLYFLIANESGNPSAYKKALHHLDALSGGAPGTKEIYEEILYMKADICFRLGSSYDEEGLSAIEEYLGTFSSSFDENKEITKEMLLIQGLIYERNRKIELAIYSFQSYLKYDPNSKEIIQKIRLLSEKKGE